MMGYVVLTVIGFIAGGFCVAIGLDQLRKKLAQQREQQLANAARLQATHQDFVLRQHAFEEAAARRNQEIQDGIAQLNAARAAFDARFVSYEELANENSILKADLRNLYLQARKSSLDVEQQSQRHSQLNEKVNELGSKYLKDNVKWISASLNSTNYANCKQRLETVVERCREIGLDVSDADAHDLFGTLKAEYEQVVRATFEREEQARIRAQIREEQLRQKEIDRAIEQANRERDAIQKALARALQETQGKHNEEIARLTARLAEAEAKSQRAISQAQLTKAGNVYVISNIGSFGEGIFKIGMTRRLEPLDRICELGDASVPYPFDVHMMIAADDAPTLENALHRAFHKSRLNKTNPRKEFFRTSIEAIYQVVREHHGEVQYVADAEALQYRQSLTMTDDEEEFIEDVFEDFADEDEAVCDEAARCD